MNVMNYQICLKTIATILYHFNHVACDLTVSRWQISDGVLSRCCRTSSALSHRRSHSIYSNTDTTARDCWVGIRYGRRTRTSQCRAWIISEFVDVYKKNLAPSTLQCTKLIFFGLFSIWGWIIEFSELILF